MGMPFSCHCPERKKPTKERAWVVVTRNRHFSTFSTLRNCGGTYTPYSFVKCLACGAVGRTKAAYVLELKDAKEAEP
jgi:hypothetical protein